MSDAVNIAQLRTVQGFSETMEVVEIRELVDGCVELRCNHHVRRWTTGRETYLWLDGEGRMMANASKEMEDGGPPPRTWAKPTSRRLVYIGRRFPDWDVRRFSGHAVEEKNYMGFFSGTSAIGIVPDIRAWCIEQIENRRA